MTSIEPLSRAARNLLEVAAGFARRRSNDLYLVGGAVRDMLAGWQVRDLDLAWLGEGDPEHWSRDFAEHLGVAGPKYHSAFLTAIFEIPGVGRLDLGRARSETYAEPAALPQVRRARLNADLRRRDFTVNAMAVAVETYLEDSSWRRRLIDPAAGAVDLEHRHLRVLHARSFVDDPTRILRGLELAVRHGLAFEPETRKLAQEAVAGGAIGLLSGARVRAELERLFCDPRDAARAARALEEFGLDVAIGAQLRIATASRARLERLQAWPVTLAPFWLAALSALTWDQEPSDRQSLARRLDLDKHSREQLVRAPERIEEVLQAAAVDSGPTVQNAISELSTFERTLLRCLGHARVQGAVAVFDRGAETRLGINGEDLLASGIEPGPGLGAALEATLQARRTRSIGAGEELAFALDWIRDHSGERHGTN